MIILDDFVEKSAEPKVLPSKLDWVLTTIEAFWEKYWALIDFQCVLESYVKLST